jgi:hypothetical protein
MSALNQFELSILNKIAAEYPVLKTHLPFLVIKSREKTGVGMYVNFDYEGQPENMPLISTVYNALSAKESLIMEGLKYGLAYEISITNGMIDFLELVTYGEEWDGEIRNFSFEVN